MIFSFKYHHNAVFKKSYACSPCLSSLNLPMHIQARSLSAVSVSFSLPLICRHPDPQTPVFFRQTQTSHTRPRARQITEWPTNCLFVPVYLLSIVPFPRPMSWGWRRHNTLEQTLFWWFHLAPIGRDRAGRLVRGGNNQRHACRHRPSGSRRLRAEHGSPPQNDGGDRPRFRGRGWTRDLRLKSHRHEREKVYPPGVSSSDQCQSLCCCCCPHVL